MVKEKGARLSSPKGEAVGRSEGLTYAEVASARELHGQNVLPRVKRRSFFRKLLSNMGDPVIKILLCALLVDVLLLFRSGSRTRA